MDQRVSALTPTVLGVWVIAAVLCMSSASSEFSLTILHTNDVHARFEESNINGGACRDHHDQCYGGVARRKSKVDQIRNDTENVLFLDAGDQYQGTLWFYYYGGNATRYFMNLLQYDAMTFGNHEFDNGVDGLVPFLENVRFPVVSANIDATKDPIMKGTFNKSVVLEVGGQRIGVIGYITTDTPELVPIVGVKDLVFNDEIEAVQAEVTRLQDDGVKIIIALGHAGYPKDQQIAAKVRGLDVVVGGHTNTFLYTGEAPSNDQPVGPYPVVIQGPSGGHVLVVQEYTYGKYLGRLDLTFDENGHVTKWGGNPILLNASIPEDPAILADIKKWKEPILELTKTVVGRANVYLEGYRGVCRNRECNIGNLITDAVLLYSLRLPHNGGWTETSIAVWNGGGIRASIGQGDFTIEDVLTVLPFRNTVTRITMFGRHLVEILEHAVYAYDEESPPGAFLQMSGMRVTYDLLGVPGQRVKDVFVRCQNCSIPKYERLNPKKVYAFLVSDFIADGGDKYDMIAGFTIERLLLEYTASDALMDFAKKRSPITHGLENRIVFERIMTGGASAVGQTWLEMLALFTCQMILLCQALTWRPIDL